MEGYSARPSAFRPDARTQERPEDLSDFQRAGSVRLAADQRASPVPQCMTDLSADIRTCSDNIPSMVSRCPSARTADALNGLNVYIYIYLYIALFLSLGSPLSQKSRRDGKGHPSPAENGRLQLIAPGGIP